MNEALPISIDQSALKDFCQRWKITELALFGSILRDDFGPDSDVDVLVTFDPDATPSMFEFLDAKRELATLFGRDVDLIERPSLEKHHNPWLRYEILSEAKTVYQAA